MRGKIFYHGSCFDGATSAALFAAFYRAQHSSPTLSYRPMAHTAGDPFEAVSLDGDDNICLDFRYCADPRMNWWFDHHVSAFQPRSLKDHFTDSPSPQKFYDPTAQSCAILITQTLEAEHGFAFEGEIWRELIEWADKIDGARFANAKEAVELDTPALEITSWLAHFGHEEDRAAALIELLGQRPLGEISSLSWVADPLVPVFRSREKMIALIEKRSSESGGVVFYDLSTDEVSVHNKFIAYMLHPQSRYTVGLTTTETEAKISVGFNPWSNVSRKHNVAEICESYGGGGHPVVGGVSMPRADIAGARRVAFEICELLRR